MYGVTNLLTAVVPKSAESNDTTYGGGTLTASNFRHQQVYGSNEFSTGPILIEELRFRPDRVYGMAFNTTISNIQVNLSTTQRNPTALSSTYAQNVGADDTVGFQGSLSISSQFAGPANGPKAFDMIVRLSQPFFYNPASGHLVVDVRNFSGSSASAISGQTGPDTAWRVLGALGSATGTIDSGVDAIQIVYAPATNLAPIIVAHPTNQTVLEGGTVSFGVSAIGSFPLSYQWRRDAAVIPGATNSTMTLTNVQLSQAGNYSAVVSNAYGVATSQTATLAVNAGLTLVVPRLNENVEGQSASSLLRDPIRLQQVYGSSQFPTGQVVTIREIRLRPSATAGSAFTSSIPNLQINMSTTPVQPDALSASFLSNVGSNDAVVFSGPITVSSRFTGPVAGPKGFDIVIPLTTPFVYNPVNGNLLVDWRNHSGSSAVLVDTATGAADQASRVFALGASSTTAIAADTGAEVLQLVYTVQGSAPAIASHPTNQTIIEGSGVTFSVSATGSQPLAYQWRRGAVLIPDATNSALILTNVQLSHAGDYSVVVSNIFGVATSQTATLTVGSALVVPNVSRTLDDGGGSGILQDVLRGQMVYDASQFPAEIIRILELRMRPSAALGNAFTSTISNFQINLSTTSVEAEQMNAVLAQNVGPDDTIAFQGSLTVSSRFVGPANGPKEFDIVLPLAAPFVYDPMLGNLLIDFRNFSGSSATIVDLGRQVGDGSSRALAALGATSASALDVAAEVLQIVYTIETSVPPAIITQPTNQTVVEGSSVTFSVRATGSQPLSYQWRQGVAVIPNATNSTLMLTNVQLSHSGDYSVVVSNIFGVATSETATLTTYPAPSLADHDLSRDFSLAGNPNGVWSYGRQDTIGGAFTLLGTAKTNFANVPIILWAISASTQPAIQHNDTTETVIIGGEGNYPPETTWFGPGVQGQPGNYVIARFTVPAGGDGTYQLVTAARPGYNASLQLDTDFHVVRNNVEIFGVQLNGSQTADYTNTLGLAAGDTIDFAVGRGADNSYIWSQLKIEATLDRTSTNGVAPVILAHPTNQTVVEGSSVMFGVNASGSAPLRYQWRRDVTAIPGATNSTLVLTNVPLSQASFLVVISNAFGVATSQTATLTVTGGPPTVVTHPANQTVVEGSSVTFGVAASGSAPLRYQWRRGVVVIPDATNSTLILTNVQLSQAGSYSVLVSNVFGVATSQSANLTVYRAPSLADYDLSRDFSLAGNPNGAWSYGRQNTIGGPFTLLGTKKTNFANVPVILWAISASSQPAIQHNDTTQTAITDGGQGLFPPETTWFAPGVQGQTDNYAVARLSVPAGGDGTYELMTSARPTYEASLQRDTDFHVARNNVEIFGAQLNGTQTARYTNTLALGAGDTIDFAVGRGADNSYIWSGLKVEVELTRLWSKFTNSVFNFGFDARRGNCAVEASTNLINWVTLTNVFAPSGRVNITDPASGSLPHRFYRVRLLQ